MNVEEKVGVKQENSKNDDSVNSEDNVANIVISNVISHDWHTQTKKYIEKMEGGTVKCTVCEKVLSGPQRLNNMKQHVEIHIEGLSSPCQNCEKTYKASNSLRKHLLSHNINKSSFLIQRS